MNSMRAFAVQKYGPLNLLQEVQLPVPDPGRGEIRVRVHASALNPADYKVITGAVKFLHGRRFPMVVGYDFSGVVEAVGGGVKNLKVGDAVFGFLPYSPFSNRGAFAETLIAQAKEVALKPASVSHLQAAASPTPALTALQSLRDLGGLGVKSTGSRVLVTGSSGGVGSLGVWISHKLGATVTAIGSGKGLELAKKMGADKVVDRKSENVFAAARGPFDVVFDAAGAYRWKQWQPRLNPGGTFVTTLPSLGFVVDKMTSILAASGTAFVNCKSRGGDLAKVAEWLATGLEVPITATIPVRELASGLARLAKNEVLGRIAVQVQDGF